MEQDEGGKVEIMLVAVEETVGGLFGAVIVEGDRTLWLRGRHILVRRADGTSEGWRWQTDDDLCELFEAEAIDLETLHRQMIRVLR